MKAVGNNLIIQKIEHAITKSKGGLLLNNIFLCASAATILLGTIWPLIIEVITGQDIFSIIFFMFSGYVYSLSHY